MGYSSPAAKTAASRPLSSGLHSPFPRCPWNRRDFLLSGLYPSLLQAALLSSPGTPLPQGVTHQPQIAVFCVPLFCRPSGVVLGSTHLSGFQAHLFPSWCGLIRSDWAGLSPIQPLALPPSVLLTSGTLPSKLSSRLSSCTGSPDVPAALTACTKLLLHSSTTQFRAGKQPFFNKDFYHSVFSPQSDDLLSEEG